MMRMSTANAPVDMVGVLADRLCRDLARHHQIAFDAVRDQMKDLPPDFLPLLNGPMGWTALGEMVCADLGGGQAPFLPTVH